MRITPTPTADLTIWFTYYKEDLDKQYGIDWNTSSVSASTGEHIATSLANMPLEAIAYGTLNPLSRDWIRRYSLAVAKEILGNIRGKFQSIPIPGGEVTLDGDFLKQSAAEEKKDLMDELKEQLDAVSYEKLMAKKEEIANSLAKINSRIPFRCPVLIG